MRLPPTLCPGRYGNNCSPVSASSTKIALTGQFSAASRIFSTSVAGGIDGFRLAVVVETKHLCGDRLAHGVPDADVVVHPDAQVASQWKPPIAS